MRRILSALLSVLVVVAAAYAAEKKLGQEITVKETTKISAILADPGSFHDKRVLVEGTLVDVCKKRGCWAKIAEEGSSAAITFKVQDGVIVFTPEMKGGKVRAQGVVQHKPAGDGHGHEGGKGCDGCAASVLLKGEGAVVGGEAQVH